MKKTKMLLTFALPLLLVPIMSGCQTKASQSLTPDSYLLDLYAANDVHGRIMENNVSSRIHEPGLAKTSTYLKTLKSKADNFIFLNSGDMFQDTYDSYSNRGHLMAECLPLMGTEAMAIGNHEFDWGIETLKENRKLAKDTTFLSANVYHYDKSNDRILDFASEVGQEYKIIERNGLKIGIIGIIGKDQITSILSTLVDNYVFVEPTNIVKKIAEKLKNTEKCDAVVLCAHADYNQLQEQTNNKFVPEITSVSPLTNKRYVDAVFTAHSHKNQIDYFNNVPFIQSGAHGEELGHIQLDLANNDVKYTKCEHINIPFNVDPDPTITAVIDKYLNAEYYEKRDEVLCTTDAYSISRDNAGRLLAWLTYETLMEDENAPKDIDVVLNNGGRSKINVSNNELKRIDIFNALPFTNKTKVVKVKGYDLKRVINDFDYPYFAPQEIVINPNNIYTVAVIDYVLYHQNSERKYNYFTSFDENNIIYNIDAYGFDIVSDYLKTHHASDGGYDLLYNDMAKKPEYTNLSF